MTAAFAERPLSRPGKAISCLRPPHQYGLSCPKVRKGPGFEQGLSVSVGPGMWQMRRSKERERLLCWRMR